MTSPAGLLNSNILTNLFTEVGSSAADLGSAAAINLANKAVLSHLGPVGGFLSSQLASTLRNLLFTRPGARATYDPVWKLALWAITDPNTGITGAANKTIAGDLAGSNYPKNKFNYTIALSYRNTILNQLMAGDPRLGSIFMDKMYFHVKTMSRPNPTVNFQDINFYNYRTKVATKVDYGTITVTFYDDIQNTAHDILTLYLKALSPIANVPSDTFASVLDQSSIDPQSFDPNVSSLGALNNGEEAGLIKSITLVHQLPFSYTPASSATNQGGVTVGADGMSEVTVVASNGSPHITANTIQYVYMNPKVTNFTLDDLDMSTSEPASVSLTFTYDTVFINKVPITVDIQNNKPASFTSGNSFLSSITNNPTFQQVQKFISF